MSKQAKKVGLGLLAVAAIYYLFIRKTSTGTTAGVSLYNKVATATGLTTIATTVAPSTGPATETRTGIGHF